MLISFEASTLRRSAGDRSSMQAPSRCRSKPPDQVEPVHHFLGRNPGLGRQAFTRLDAAGRDLVPEIVGDLVMT
ncbi:hypothetical protein QFZ74_002204 [Streptomyces sp. V3I7]|nr:hypothetical protein [Streptomyces sp. V3I7]